MRHQDIKTSRHQDIKTSESRKIYHLLLMLDQPANECENSEVVNEEYSGTPYGTSIPCSHNCDEIED